MSADHVLGLGRHNYATSRDYRALWDLLQKTPVVCVADWQWCGDPETPLRDICATRWYDGLAAISCRGISYVHAMSVEEFVTQCERANVDAILPHDQVCYVVIHEDHHADTDLEVFLDASKAVEYAKATAREYDRFGELDETMTDAMKQAGWLYYGRYSCDGDSVRVVKKAMQ